MQGWLESSVLLGLTSRWTLVTIGPALHYAFGFRVSVHDHFHLDTLHVPITSGHGQANLTPLDIPALSSGASSQHGCLNLVH